MRKGEIRVGEISTVVRNRVEELPEHGLDAIRSAVALGQMTQPLNDHIEFAAFWKFESLADELVDLFAYGSAVEPVANPASLSLYLQQQVEVTQL